MYVQHVVETRCLLISYRLVIVNR